MALKNIMWNEINLTKKYILYDQFMLVLSQSNLIQGKKKRESSLLLVRSGGGLPGRK